MCDTIGVMMQCSVKAEILIVTAMEHSYPFVRNRQPPTAQISDLGQLFSQKTLT